MISKGIIDSIEKYSFVTKVTVSKDFYITVFYKTNGKERHKSISRRANHNELVEFLTKIRMEADKPMLPEFKDDLPIEIV